VCGDIEMLPQNPEAILLAEILTPNDPFERDLPDFLACQLARDWRRY
jgi:hypothetical protein